MNNTIQTINLTPTWADILPLLLAVIVDGTQEGKAHAVTELQRMAEAADRFNTFAKDAAK